MRIVPILTGLLMLALSCTGAASAGREEFLTAYCQTLRPCCQQAHLPDEPADCRARLDPMVPRTGFDPQAAGACLAALRAAAARSGFCQKTDPDQRACDGLFFSERSLTGSKLPGERCLYRGECAPSDEGPVVCQQEYDAGGRARACQVQIRGRQGDGPCTFTIPEPVASFPYPDLYAIAAVTYRSRPILPDSAPPPARAYHCYRDDGLRCSDGEQRCVPLARVGEPCTSYGECVAGAFCDQASRSCQARRPMGAACAPGGFGESPCQAGGYCDAATRTCSPQVGLGAACTQDGQCTTGVCANQSCAASDLADLGASRICGGL
jgi:hypothetical protein